MARRHPVLADGMVRVKYGERLDGALMQPVINVAAKYSKFPPFKADDIMYKAAR